MIRNLSEGSGGWEVQQEAAEHSKVSTGEEKGQNGQMIFRLQFTASEKVGGGCWGGGGCGGGGGWGCLITIKGV